MVKGVLGFGLGESLAAGLCLNKTKTMCIMPRSCLGYIWNHILIPDFTARTKTKNFKAQSLFDALQPEP